MNTGHQANLSPYYPPRARWYTRILHVPAERILRTLHLKQISLPGDISFLQFLLSIALPGVAFFFFGRRRLGQLFVTAYGLSAAVFVVGLGYLVGSIAFTLLISIHTTSIVFLEGIWLGKERLGLRLAASLCTLIVIWALIYSPGLQFVEDHWLMPLRLGNRVLVVRRASARSIHRGDWVAYRISAESASRARESKILVREGFGIQPVLAAPGDRVRFEPNRLLVNGQPMALAARMPKSGDFVLSEKVWFIWPDLGIDLHGAVAETDISAAFRQLALVPEDEIFGKAFRFWFGRRQSL